jgi:hypothetical protein
MNVRSPSSGNRRIEGGDAWTFKGFGAFGLIAGTILLWATTKTWWIPTLSVAAHLAWTTILLHKTDTATQKRVIGFLLIAVTGAGAIAWLASLHDKPDGAAIFSFSLSVLATSNIMDYHCELVGREKK